MLNLVCLLEEPSAKEMLKAVLPKILPESVAIRYMVFEGKQDLEKRLEARLRGWQTPDSCFLILRDQDSGDCIKIKKNLLVKVKNSGKASKTLIRIACHELESFYLGDLTAVENGLGAKNISKQQNTKRFRNPDQLTNAAQILSKISSEKYQKKQGSRDIAPYLKLDGSNTSCSFNNLITGLKNLPGNGEF